MRPENLKPPVAGQTRAVVIQDRVWYIPSHSVNFEDYIFPGWSHPDFFGNNNPVYVEYCTGNGAWVAAKALEQPHINWVAVEKKFMRVKKVWSKIKNLKLNNLVVICGEGCNATQRYFPDNSVSGIFINFPDPWPKTRHAKHRIIQPAFIREMQRVLLPNHALTFVTDDVEYSEWMINFMSQNENFQSSYSNPFYSHELPDYGTSYFDQLWREKGRSIRYHRFTTK